MKTKLLLTATVSAFFILHSALGQGALTPPGAPATTMKTLDQLFTKLEARTPIAAAPFTIAVSGSYYLTTNLTVSSSDAITIAANNVTLDLNGFTISSTRPIVANDSAILMSGGRTNISIYNGHISSGVTNAAGGAFSGSGFASGIYATPPLFNVRVKNVSVAGVLYYGIALTAGDSTVVEACTVTGAGFDGIAANSVSDSTAMNCGSVGINAGTANNCKGSGVGNGFGVNAITANNCYGTSSANTGLNADTANNCRGVSSIGTGLSASSVATGCYGSSGSSTGLSAFIANGCRGVSTSGAPLSVTHNVNSF
jgi:hypothetical protein